MEISKRIAKFRTVSKKFRSELSATVYRYLTLIGIMILAFAVRMLPYVANGLDLLRGYDPRMQYRAAKIILDKGIIGYILYYDTMSRYPRGRELGSTSYIGIPISGVIVYKILTALGIHVSLQQACAITPVIFGTFTVLAMYLLTRELTNERAALFAAFLIAVLPGHIRRTIYGFFDDEALGVLMLLLTLRLFLIAYKRSSAKAAFLGMLTMTVLAMTRGAFRLVYALLAIYAVLLLILGRSPTRIIVPYTIVVMGSMSLAMTLPRVGAKVLGEPFNVIALALIPFMALYAIVEEYRISMGKASRRKFILYSIIGVAVIVAVVAVLSYYGMLPKYAGKFLGTILPFLRTEEKSPLFQSVSEHQPTTRANIYTSIYLTIFFIPLAVYYILQGERDEDVFMFILLVVGLYVIGNMARLALIGTPFLVVVTAYAMDRFLIPFGRAIRGAMAYASSAYLRIRRAPKTHLALAYIVVASVLAVSAYYGIHDAYHALSPHEMVLGTEPGRYRDDRRQALERLREHGGPTTVVVSRRDYGYRITVLGNSTSVIDNGTLNSTQIGMIARAFLMDEYRARQVFRMFNVKYVVVMYGGGYLQISDIAKSYAMMIIAQKYAPRPGVTVDKYYDKIAGRFTDEFRKTTLYKLCTYRLDNTVTQILTHYPQTSGARPAGPLLYFHEVFTSDNNVVRIYQVASR